MCAESRREERRMRKKEIMLDKDPSQVSALDGTLRVISKGWEAM